MSYKHADEEVKRLIERLAERDEEARADTIRSLTSLGGAAVPYLLNALRDIDRWYSAVETLASIGEPSIEPLISLLSDSAVDSFAFEALTKIGRPAVMPLISALEDDNVGVRCWAAQALGWIEDTRAVDALSNILGNGDERIEQYAREALNRINNNN